MELSYEEEMINERHLSACDLREYFVKEIFSFPLKRRWSALRLMMSHCSAKEKEDDDDCDGKKKN